MESRKIRTMIDGKKGELAILQASLKQYELQYDKYRTNLDYIVEAQLVLQQTAQKTQQRLSYHISSFITSALESIWGEDSYTFTLNFIEKRNKTEVEMLLHTNEGDIDLKDLNSIRVGGGILDIVALALRIALWSLQVHPKKIMILDQPLSNVDQNYLPKAGKLIKELSDKLDIQFIIINHNPALADIADNNIEVVKENNISKIL